MASLLTQLRTVLWRNILIKRRAWKKTILEVLTPLLLVGVMILVKLGVHPHTDRQTVGQFPAHDITRDLFAPSHPITASPAVHVTSDIMDHVIEALNVTSVRYYIQDDVISTEADMKYLDRHNMTEVGIEFLLKNTSEMTRLEGYVIRMPHDIVQHVTSECSFRENMETCARSTDGLTRECPGSQSLLSGLLRLQWAVETALIQTFWDSGFKPPALQVQMMPMSVFRPGATNIQLLVSLSMVIALTPLAYCVTATLVTEKKTWVKVMLKVMGLSNCVFWVSWWLTYMLTVVVTAALASVLVFSSGILDGPGVGFFFLVVALYGVSLLGFSSVVSVFFRAPKIAGCTSGVTSVLLGLLYLSVSLTRPSSWTSAPETGSHDLTLSPVPLGGQLVFSLFPPAALALGVDKLIYFEEEQLSPDMLGGQFPLLAIVLMLVLDCVLYGLLALYLDTIVPAQNHISRKPCFCMTSSCCRSRSEGEDSDAIPTDTPEGPHVEPLPDCLSENRIIRVRDLSKSFNSGQKKPVFGLNGLDLDIVEGQITCILGHPGAGKTTLINILAGVTSPSSGVAFIQNLNVSSIRDQTDLSSVVTVCPQRNLILGHLTVEEHMYINGRLRGVPPSDLEQETGSMLTTFHLDDERRTMAQELTGCQRRRLSLAMALLVDTKVILLDEPTLGMEPDERRHLLRLLHEKKEGRVIVFTSKHMDEADYYSDRKVVLSRGRLRCVGSSDFLKEHFNVGYCLNMTVREGTNTDRVLRVVRSHVRGASLVRRQDNVLTITVPLSQAGKITALFRQLESKDRGCDYLGVSRSGITFTTLDQVFWKLGEEEEGGNVFISPLLTPIGNDTLSSGGDIAPARFAQTRGSMIPCQDEPKRDSGDSTTKASKNRSKSLAVWSMKKDSVVHVSEELGDRPGFVGPALPTSLAKRRATVDAIKGLRSLAQQKILPSVSSFNDIPTMPADPMTKLSVLGTFEEIQKSSLTDTDDADSCAPEPEPDPEHVHAPPLKMGEVLANLQPARQGVSLELQRLWSLLKLRVMLRLYGKWWVLVRLVTAVGLTLLAVGMSHAVLPAAGLSSRQKDRVPLFGISRLAYRNTSGKSVDSLLANFSRSGHVPEHAGNYQPDSMANSSSLQGLLDILESNGGAYRLHYNASCALALPHLISFLANVTRNSPDSAATTLDSNSSSRSGKQRDVTLAPSVSAWLQPWPSLSRHKNRGDLDWVPVLFLGLALFLTVSTYAHRLIAERKERLRSYMAVIGVSRWMYYGTITAIDVIEFIIPASLLLLLCGVSRMAIFEAKGSVYSLAILVALYAVAGVLWVYAASFVCRQSATWLFCLTPLVVLVTLGCFALVIFMESDTESTATILHYVFTVVWAPYVPFGALHYMAKVGSKEKLTDSHTLYVFNFDSNIDICFIMLSVDIICLWLVVLILDKVTFRPPTLPCNCKKPQRAGSAHCNVDDGVHKEAQRIQELLKDRSKWPKLVVDEATKVFSQQRGEVRAVDRVTFGVHQGEVLGLLGPPDAGKSSLLSMMLGLSPLSAGSVYMDFQSREAMTSRESSEKIGYCPPYNPLWDNLTVDQHIRFVGQIKGLSKDDLHSFRHSLYHDLDLRHCRSQKIKQLSNGARRKLSFAMSMVGTQSFMLLDEPSAGMDIRSRRLYWDAVNYFLKASQRSTVISTQCSEEAQTLCTRLALMVNGQLRCLGTPEELSATCEETYRLEVTLGRWEERQGPRRMNMLLMFLEELFPGLQKLEQFEDRVLFRIHSPGNPLSLATTFQTLESLKRNLDLEDFTFSQTDTEQMFLHFSRDQKEGDSRFSPVTAAPRHSTPGTTKSANTATNVQAASPNASPQPHSRPVHSDTDDGVSFEDATGDRDTAEGVVIVLDGYDEERVVSEKEGAATEAAGAAILSLKGVDNPAYTATGEDDLEEQTSL